MSDRETEEERLVREVFSPNRLLSCQPDSKRLYLLPPSSLDQAAETPAPTASPLLVLIRGGKED